MSSRRRPDSASAELIGRELELTAIEQLLSAGREGLAVLLLEGEAGIGKTTLFREALRRAEAHGFHVLSCRPGASEVAMPLAAVAELLGAMSAERLKALPTPQRRALASALLEVDPGDRPIAERAVAAGMRSLVSSLAAERPVLLAVDDVQWLDAASVGVLDFVIRRLTTERVALLATRRLLEPVKLDLEALVPRDTFARVRMTPLSLGALQRLLKERLGTTFQRSTLVRIHATSGGNPLFALEIGRALAERPPLPHNEPLPVPDDIRSLVRERVVVLPEATRDLLLAAALLTHPTVDTLRRVCGRAPDVDLEPAERATIATIEQEVVRFAHPLHAAAVIATATTGERRRMHLRLADVVEELDQRAQHLAFGTSEPDEAIARLLEEGAAAARSRGGVSVAAELLERARDLTPPNDAVAARARGIRAAELHCHAGDRARARSLLEELMAEAIAPGQRADALRLLAELSLDEEDRDGSERLLLEALAIADDPRTSARIQVELAHVLTLRMDFAGAADHSHQALERLAGTDDRPLLAEALAFCAMADYLAGRGVDWSKVERALALEDHSRVALAETSPSGLAAYLMMYVGRHAEARNLFRALCNRLTEHGDDAELGQSLIWLSWLETRCGNFGAAAEIADEAITCASTTANRSLERWAIAQRAYVDAHVGDLADARRRCAEAAVLDQGGNASAELFRASALALAEVSAGDHEAAWRASRGLTEVIERYGVVQVIVLMHLPDSLEALVGLGQLDRTEAILDALEAPGGASEQSWALTTRGRCRALLLAARGDPASALAMLDATLTDHDRFELPFERARTLLVKGIVERRLRRRADARRTLAEALAEFERMGAKLWAERARSELDRVGGRQPRSAGELSASERRVAELAAGGLSNKEIAAALFVSVHTVEVHLSHAYAKLGVHSRARLAERLRTAH